MLNRAKKTPGKLTYTITGYGSAYHILTKLVEREAGVSMSPVPYRGIAAGVMDVMNGRVDVLVDASTSAMPRIQSGEFRILAVSSGQHFDLMSDAPTVSLKNVDFMSWLCFAAPSSTPKAITDRLSSAVRDILVEPAFTKRLNELGSVPKPTTPDQTRRSSPAKSRVGPRSSSAAISASSNLLERLAGRRLLENGDDIRA